MQMEQICNRFVTIQSKFLFLLMSESLSGHWSRVNTKALAFGDERLLNQNTGEDPEEHQQTSEFATSFIKKQKLSARWYSSMKIYAP